MQCTRGRGFLPRLIGVWPCSYFLRPESVSEDMLQHYEEMLQWNVIRVQLTPELKAALNHLGREMLHITNILTVMYTRYTTGSPRKKLTYYMGIRVDLGQNAKKRIVKKSQILELTW